MEQDYHSLEDCVQVDYKPSIAIPAFIPEIVRPLYKEIAMLLYLSEGQGIICRDEENNMP